MTTKNTLADLLSIMATLRDPERGCPWDKAQDFASILPHTIEETYEVVDAIEKQHWTDVKDELGDLLFQIIFYSQLGKEKQLFTFEDVVDGICTKLIRRHPHVFGERDADGTPVELADWEGIKKQERAEKTNDSDANSSILADIPQAFPALIRANKIQKRCAQVGFDWTEISDVVDKVREEIDEVMEEVAQQERNQQRVDEEIGDLLFAVVNLARHVGTKPEMALRHANDKFARRFHQIEKRLQAGERKLQDCQLDELESLWQAVKLAEKRKSL